MSDVDKTVVAIQGNPVKREILNSDQDGHVLTWVDSNNEWEAKLPSSGSGPAGGDLAGTYPNPTVVSLTGNSGVVLCSDLTLTTASSCPVISVSSSVDAITLSTDNVNGGNNGPIYIVSGTAPGSLSGSCHNVYIDAGAQNGVNQGTISITTGYGYNTGQGITLDSFNSSLDFNTSQIGVECARVRFNNTGLCFSQILTVDSTYTVNNGRTDSFDYTILGDTTSAAFTISLPPAPLTGETYILKDFGNGSVNNLTIDGNGANIDGSATYVITTNYGGITVVFNGTTWTIISKI